MKRILCLIFFLFAFSVAAFPQSGTAQRLYSGTRSPEQRNTNCLPGDVFYGTDTVLVYICTASGVWGSGISPSPSAGAGTVTTVSVVSANGFSGSVANATTTPAITINNPTALVVSTSVAIGGGSAITSSGAGGTLGSNAFNSTAYMPLTGGTFTGDVTHSGGAIIISGNISAPTWTTNGVRIKGTPGTLTDTTAATGTTPTAYTDVLGGNTIAATNASVVYTNYFALYAKDSVAGTNVTLTNKWAIGGDSAKFGTSNQVTISNAGVLTATSPVFTTPNIGVATATSVASGAITASGTIVQTSASATSFVSGPNGATNPLWVLNNSTASQADGTTVSAGAAGTGTTFTATSSGSNAGWTFISKGTGGILISSAGVNTVSLLGLNFQSVANPMGFYAAASTELNLGINGTDEFSWGPGRAVMKSTTLLSWSTTSNLSATGDAAVNRVAAKVIAAGSAAGTSDHWFVDAGTSRVSSQFDVTSSTTLANVTGLTANVIAGRKYSFVAELYTSSNVAGGVQVAIAGTATATSVVYDGFTISAGTTTQGRSTTLGTTVAGITAVTAAHITIKGTLVCNAGGTLTVQFSQNVSNAAASSVLINSTFVVRDLNN